MRRSSLLTAAALTALGLVGCSDESTEASATTTPTGSTGLGGSAGAAGSGGDTGGAGAGGGGGGEIEPLGISDDGHWLEYGGRPLLLAGDSVTQGWMELGTAFDQTAYLDALAARQINLAMVWTFIGIVDQVADTRIGYDAPELWPWAFDGSSFDLAALNDAYFDRLRQLVDQARQRGVAVLVTVHDGWTKTRFAGHPFNAALGGPLTSEAQYVELYDYAAEMPTTFDAGWSRPQRHQFYLERFCDRLLAATGDLPNVMYEMFNEGEWYDQADLRRFQLHFLEFFAARTARPLVVNDDHVGGDDFRDEPLAHLISNHRPLWTTATSASEAFVHYAAQFDDTPVKPLLFSEPVPSFEGGAAERLAMMRLMWGTLLGGASFVVQNDLSFGFDDAAAVASQGAERDAMLDLEGHAAHFFADRLGDPTGLAPDASACSSGVCMVRPGHTYVAYLQDADAVTVDLSAASGPLEVSFFDPQTGSVEDGDPVTGGSTAEALDAPAVGDWVVLVRVP